MGLFNLVWFLVFGWWLSLSYFVLSWVFMLTVVGIPIGKSLHNFAKLNAFPFGKQVVREKTLKGSEKVSSLRSLGGIVVNILWLPIGVLLSLIHLALGLIMFITIIGIPIGIVQVRMAKFLLFPIGAKVISREDVIASKVVNKLREHG